MRVSIHQPDYLPWLGFFAKIDRADFFVLLDTAEFVKGKFQHRNKIRSWNNPGWRYLSIPLGERFYGRPFAEVPLPEAAAWRRDHWRLIVQNYRRAPYAKPVLERLEPIYADAHLVTLAALNERIIRSLLELFGIPTRVVKASELKYDRTLRKTALNIGICQEVGASSYLSGPSGRTYLDLAKFERASIGVEFLDYHPAAYPQVHGEFIPGLSAVDLLCNVGPAEARRWLQKDSTATEMAQRSA